VDEKTRRVIERDKLGALTKMGQGGQGVVYRAPNVKTKFAASMVFKEYRTQTRAGLDFTALAAMPALVEESLSYAQAERLVSIAAWPCALVEERGAPVGFVMPAISEKFFIPFTTVKGVSNAAAEFQHLLNHSSVLAARGINIDDAQRYSLLREVASGLAFLHRHGVCVGDISPKNLLFSLNPHEAVYFIDCDAMRINEVSVSPQVETPGWQVPAGEELATVYSDAYKLGLLALRLVAGDHDTANLQHIPSTAPGLLRQVITDTITKAPHQRPLPEAWTYVLGNAIEQAQYQKKTAPSSTPAGTPLLAPPTPVLHSRPSIRPSAPPPPPSAPPTPQSRPPVAPSTAPAQSEYSTKFFAGVTAAVLAVVAVVAISVGIATHSRSTTASAPATSTTDTPSTFSYSSPTTTEAAPVDPEVAALQQLQQLAAEDRPLASSQLADRWIPQLSSKHGTEPFTYDNEDGTTYTSTQTLQEHQRLRQQYGAKLLWSGDWTTYDHPDYWVTVVPQTFSDPSGVLSWCTNNGRDSDHCSAEMISTTLGSNGTHEH
jgi:serine/threonine protein kinase